MTSLQPRAQNAALPEQGKKLSGMSEDEQLALLAADGMLVKIVEPGDRCCNPYECWYYDDCHGISTAPEQMMIGER